MKLNLKPRIFILEFLLLIIASVIDIKPLSLILLWPTYTHSSEGWFMKIFSAKAFAPSYPILLLKTFKNFRDLLFLRETASSLAPDTPSWFLLRSKTSMILLWGKTYDKALIPSFPMKFLDKFKTFIWLLNAYLLGSNANTMIWAKFLFRPFPDSDRFVRFYERANNLTKFGSSFLISLLKWVRLKDGFIDPHPFSCRAFKLL